MYAISSEEWDYGGLLAFYTFLWFGFFTSKYYFCTQGESLDQNIGL